MRRSCGKTYVHRRSDPTDEAPRRCGAARGVLRRQRRLPLPRAFLRGAALRPGRRARRRVAPDRLGRRDLRPLAAALADVSRARSRRTDADRRAGSRLCRDERLLLHLDRPAPAGDGCRDRVHRPDRPRGDRCADGSQRRRGRDSGRRRVPADARAVRGGAGRGGLRLCERRAVHRLHRPRPPRRTALGPERDRRAGGGNAARLPLRLPDRALERGRTPSRTPSRSRPVSGSA